MGSYPSMSTGPDFDADAYNSTQDKRSFERSGLGANVKSGLSMQEDLPRGNIEPEQMGHGCDFRKNDMEAPAGSKNGKSFKHKS